jgi:hypothetical protein
LNLIIRGTAGTAGIARNQEIAKSAKDCQKIQIEAVRRSVRFNLDSLAMWAIS